jgi:acyl dehydratase
MSLTLGQTASYQRTFTQQDFDRFSALSGDDNPIHVDPAFSARTRFGRTVAHGMFLYSCVSRALGSLMPGPGTLQLEQELKFPTPTYTGEAVQIRLEAADLLAPGLARLSTLVVRPSGELGLEGSTLVLLPGADQVPPQGLLEPTSGESAPEYKGLRLGQSASIVRTYSQDDLVEYTNLTGDDNPIYTGDEQPRGLGFAGRIVPGGLLGGLFSYLLGVRLPGRGTNWLKQKLVFPGPAYPEEALTARVQIVRLRPEKDLVNLRATITRPDGSLACDGESLVYIRDLESAPATGP